MIAGLALNSGRQRRLWHISLHLYHPWTSVDLWNEWEQGPLCNNQTMPINSCDFCHLAFLTETEQCMKGLSSSVWSSDSQDISEYINTITLKHQRNEAVIAIKSCGTQLFQQLTYALLVDASCCAIQYWDCWSIVYWILYYKKPIKHTIQKLFWNDNKRAWCFAYTHSMLYLGPPLSE